MKIYESLLIKVEARTEEFKQNLRYNDFVKSITDLMNHYLAEYIKDVLNSLMQDKCVCSDP